MGVEYTAFNSGGASHLAGEDSSGRVGRSGPLRDAVSASSVLGAVDVSTRPSYTGGWRGKSGFGVDDVDDGDDDGTGQEEQAAFGN